MKVIENLSRKEKDSHPPWELLKNQIYLGSDPFVEDIQCKMNPEQSLQDISKLQKQAPANPLSHYQKNNSPRNFAMVQA